MFRDLEQFKRESAARHKAERDLDTNLYRFHKVLAIKQRKNCRRRSKRLRSMKSWPQNSKQRKKTRISIKLEKTWQKVASDDQGRASLATKRYAKSCRTWRENSQKALYSCSTCSNNLKQSSLPLIFLKQSSRYSSGWNKSPSETTTSWSSVNCWSYRFDRSSWWALERSVRLLWRTSLWSSDPIGSS